MIKFPINTELGEKYNAGSQDSSPILPTGIRSVLALACILSEASSWEAFLSFAN